MFKKATEREENVRLQNVLRSYGIESKLEQKFNIRNKYRCERHGPITCEDTPLESIDLEYAGKSPCKYRMN
jgi:hypothetical protein